MIKRIIMPMVLVATLLMASFILIAPAQLAIDDGVVDGSPTRDNPLYLYTESLNWSFSKPTFYDDTDPNYSGHTDLKENDWDDIAMVIVLQDKHKVTVKENNDPSGANVDCADIYQTLFVPLDGKQVDADTDQTILVEDFTATWCTYCTGVVGAMNRLDMDENWFPEKYIGIEWHSGGGTYGTGTALSTATARRSEYNLGGGIPRYVIDGMVPYVGGSSSPNVTAIDNRIRGDINTRGAADSPVTISAVGGHSTTQAWVDFDIEIVDANFDNALVEAYVFMVQDAYPRRHGSNSNAYLGWIGQASQSQRIFQVPSNDPIISDITPAEDSILAGEVEIGFNVTDPDADDSKITNTVHVAEKGTTNWSPIPLSSGSFMWNTAQKAGSNYVYPDGEYEIKIHAEDYWMDISEEIIDVIIRNPDPPLVNLKEEDMQEQIDLENTVRGDFDIIWNMRDDEDDTGLMIDIFYKSDSVIEWTPLVEDLVDVTEYTWSTLVPRVTDEEGYKLKVVITDTDEMTAEVETSFRFEINNPDPPVITMQYPPEGRELSGLGAIRWTAFDDEDSQQMLKADISISSDGGVSFINIGLDKPNSGTFSFDTTTYSDGDNYVGRVKIKDTEGYFAVAETPVFSIYNNDQPEVDFLSPAQEDTVSGEIEITWTADDQEDEDEELTYDLFYMFESDTFWKTLTVGEPNTGSYLWDTAELSEGDGIYTIKILVKDTRGLESDTITRFFTVYNPDAPVITNPTGPTSSVEQTTTISWMVYDPDPFETDQLKVWIYYRTGDSDFSAVPDAQGIVNTNQHAIDVSEWADGTYQIKLIISDCQPGANNKTSKYLFMGIIVDNNDPPVVAFTSVPDPLANNTGDLALSWEGSDPEDKGETYALYYRVAGNDGWIPISGALKLMTTSFIWNTSDLDTGDYELKIEITDGSKQKLTSEVIAPVFSVYVPVEEQPDADDDPLVIDPQGDDDNGSNLPLLLLILAIGMILFLVMIVAGVLVMKKKNAAQQIPPPGGFPPGGPAMMGAPQQPGLPGQVQTGALPAQTQPQLPAAAPEAPAQAPSMPPQEPAKATPPAQ